MVIMNLSVAAVIDGLSSARKDNTGVIKKDEVNELLVYWKEYDPKASGWISVNDLVFLIYELPQPLGYGHVFETQKQQNKLTDKSIDVDHILNKASTRKEELIQKLKDGNRDEIHKSVDLDELKAEEDKVDIEKRRQTIRLMNQSEKQDILINEERGIAMKKTIAIKILDDFNIPYYENNKVHFKDICRKLINQAFERKKMQIQVGTKLKKRIHRGWRKKYNLTKFKKLKIHVQKIMAAKFLLKWIKVFKDNRIKKSANRLERVEELERHITSRMEQELSELREEESKINKTLISLDHPIGMEAHDLQDNHDISDIRKRKSSHTNTKLSEDVDKFIKDNPEYFDSLKRMEEKKQPKNQKFKSKHKLVKNTVDTDPGAQSFLGMPVGNFFGAPRNDRKSRHKRLADMKQQKKNEKKMRSTNAFPKKKELERQGSTMPLFQESKDDNYSYQQIDYDELSFE